MKGKIQNTPYWAFLLLLLTLLVGTLSCDFYKMVAGQLEKRGPTGPCLELVLTPTPVATPTAVPTLAPPEEPGEAPGNGEGSGPDIPTITVIPTVEPEDYTPHPSSEIDPGSSEIFFDKSQLVKVQVDQNAGTRVFRDIQGFKAVLKIVWEENRSILSFSEPISFASMKMTGKAGHIGTLTAFNVSDTPVDMDVSSSEFYVAGRSIVKLELNDTDGEIDEIMFRP